MDITKTVRSVVKSLSDLVGFFPEDVSARSMKSGGAMAILRAKVDPDLIRLVGRWRSDVMLRYLHTTEKRFTQATKADDTAIPVYLWNDQIKKGLPWLREIYDIYRDLEVIRDFFVKVWQKKTRMEALKYLAKKHGKTHRNKRRTDIEGGWIKCARVK
uniref:Uncharacterized protein n=1 Tax=Odontella aurita TaxID=265563 RepID=A0A7S4I8H2_9STRA|mmetsp:Transcript_21378/g.62355  ORF Transcript_21378/g.62355 Transcript_21378/m.62355 type:complete len:158 (+) Transcript_21378:3857-4330(+)